MKKIVLLISFILSLSIVVFAASKSYFKSSDVVAVFDNIEITKSVLENYVDELKLGKKYERMLKNTKGLKTLADYYITRLMILEYAKENDYENSHFVKQHMLSEGDNKDAVMISAVLTKEINDKITVLPEEIDKYLEKYNSKDRRDAYFAIMSIKRQKKYEEFINQLKEKHEIIYNVN